MQVALRGEALGALLERTGFTERAVAEAAYANADKSVGAGVQRIRRLREWALRAVDDIEAMNLAHALGVDDGGMLESVPRWVLVREYPHPAGTTAFTAYDQAHTRVNVTPVAPAGACFAFPYHRLDDARLAARVAERAGVCSDAWPALLLDAEIDRGVLAQGQQLGWLRAPVEPDFAQILDEWERAVDIEKYLLGDDDALDKARTHRWWVLTHVPRVLGLSQPPVDDRLRRMGALIKDAVDGRLTGVLRG